MLRSQQTSNVWRLLFRASADDDKTRRRRKKFFYDILLSLHLLPAGRTGARHEWQKHWSTESRTNVINMTSTLQIHELINRFVFFSRVA